MDDYSELDPGVRRVVQWLNDRNFETTDSGDGVTKLAAGWTEEEDGIIDVPHVFITCDSFGLVAEADRLVRLLELIGITLSPIGEGVHIQATYDPVNKTASIGLFGLNDDLLFKALQEPS